MVFQISLQRRQFLNIGKHGKEHNNIDIRCLILGSFIQLDMLPESISKTLEGRQQEKLCDHQFYVINLTTLH